jgi:ComF family protein
VCPDCLAKPEPLAADYLCVCCRTPFLNSFPLDEQGRCTLCRLGAAGFDAAYAFGFYDAELRELIHLFKYNRVRTLDRPLGRLLAMALPRERSFDLIVPMPLHWRRRWERGFNQSELLARQIARRVHVPVKNVVRRKRATAAQAGLTNAKRRANVAGAFVVSSKNSVQGARVLLIDDVMTTGATARACALALKRAGASHVTFLALARVDRRAEHPAFVKPPFAESPVSRSPQDAQSGSPA